VDALNKELLEIAETLNLQVTFHRAFDLAPDPVQAMEVITGFGFDRVLSSGQSNKAEQGIDLLASLEKDYGDRIQIMAGSGVGPDNVLKFTGRGIRHLHFTARKQLGTSERFAMGGRWVPDTAKMEAVARLVG
jgi:copper homeostasis protein